MISRQRNTIHHLHHLCTSFSFIGGGRYNDRGRGRGRGKNNLTPYSRLLESDDGDDEDVSMGTGYQTGNR